jgi:hypothetical protein
MNVANLVKENDEKKKKSFCMIESPFSSLNKSPPFLLELGLVFR